MGNKNFEGIDSGFCLNYKKLSSRRKFIRTLWFGPVLLIPMVGMCYHGFAIPYVPIALVIYIVQLVRTFIAWKRKKNYPNISDEEKSVN